MVTGKLSNIIGQRFGRLITQRVVARNKQSHIMVQCMCDCGKEPVIRGYDLFYGFTNSCGCLDKEAREGRFTTHGMSRTRFYHIWQGMKERCYNPKENAS